MLQSIEAITDQNGMLRLLESIQLPKHRRVIITILEEGANEQASLALLSEPVLAQDWERPDENEVWSHVAVHLPPHDREDWPIKRVEVVVGEEEGSPDGVQQ